MTTTKGLKEQGRALCDDQLALVNDTTKTWAAKRAEYEKRDRDIKALQAKVQAQEAVEGKFGSPGGPFAMLQDPTGSGGTTTTAGLGGGWSRKAVGGLVAENTTPIPSPRLEIGDESAKELHAAVTSKRSLSIETKATDSTSIPQSLIPDYQRVPFTALREPTRVLDLIPIMAISSPVVTWYTTTGTAAANAVAEGAAKPTSTIAYNAVTGTVTKIAHVVEATDETLQDFPSFMGVLQADMIAGLILAENAELLTATVAGAHKFAGLLNTSGILTRARGADTNLDAISKAFNDLRTGTTFFEPDGIIMHPTNWQTIRLSKDTNQQYYLNPYSPVSNEVGNDLRLWGLPVTLTTQCTLNTAIVGAFQQSTRAYVRDSLRVETNQFGTTQFVNNTTLVRAEERLLLTVPRPTGIVAVTGLN